MSSRWLQELQQVFGDSRVENALEGTILDSLGKKHNFGLYVVRNAMDRGTAEAMMVQSKKSLQYIMETDVRQQKIHSTYKVYTSHQISIYRHMLLYPTSSNQ